VLSRPLASETAIGAVATALAVAAMAVDHLLGDDPGLEDPPAFLIAAGVSLVVAGIVFGLVVPRTRRDPSPGVRAARRGLVCAVLAVVSLPLVWLGVPFPLASGAIALGLLGRAGERTRTATAAIALGVLVLALASVGYGVEAVRKLS
jgi:hypothetical protein